MVLVHLIGIIWTVLWQFLSMLENRTRPAQPELDGSCRHWWITQDRLTLSELILNWYRLKSVKVSWRRWNERFKVRSMPNPRHYLGGNSEWEATDALDDLKRNLGGFWFDEWYIVSWISLRWNHQLVVDHPLLFLWNGIRAILLGIWIPRF